MIDNSWGHSWSVKARDRTTAAGITSHSDVREDSENEAEGIQLCLIRVHAERRGWRVSAHL